MAEVSQRTEELVRRLFKSDQVADALGWLQHYGDEHWHREKDRVHRAVVKLSQGHLRDLRHYVEVAHTDYRDVLWWSDEPPDVDN